MNYVPSYQGQTIGHLQQNKDQEQKKPSSYTPWLVGSAAAALAAYQAYLSYQYHSRGQGGVGSGTSVQWTIPSTGSHSWVPSEYPLDVSRYDIPYDISFPYIYEWLMPHERFDDVSLGSATSGFDYWGGGFDGY